MKTCRTAPGTILIVAIGLIAALAIIGATMINVARVDRLSARNFRQTQEMDLAKTSLIEYLQQRTAQDYWSQANSPGAQIVDDPTKVGSLLALIRPNTAGKLTIATSRSSPGLYRTSGGTVGNAGSWYSYPVSPRLPDPGKTDTLFGNVGDSSPSSDPALIIPANGGRSINMAFVMVDLCARYNLQFHGGSRMGPRGGQASTDEGFLWSELTPFWIDQDPNVNVFRPIHPNDTYPAFVTSPIGRHGASGAPTSPDHSANPFKPAAAEMLYGSDDLMELLNLWGTSGQRTRLEQTLPNSLYHNSDGNLPGEAMFRKVFFTTYSAVSGARARDTKGIQAESIDPEPIGKLCVQADLNRSTFEETKTALRAASSGLTTAEISQIMANLEGFRNKSHKPYAEQVGAETIYGVNAQPFLNEVYIQQTGGAANDQEVRTFRVYVELANPYDVRLSRGESYTRLSVGKGATQSFFSVNSLPAAIPERGSAAASGAVAGHSDAAGQSLAVHTVTVPAGASVRDYLEPVELYNSASNGTEIVIDRYKQVSLVAGQSMQRKTLQGADRTGSAKFFFNGWAANESAGDQSCMSGFVANTPGSARPRPIENRSRDLAALPAGPRGATELPFRRVGDVGRLLRFGHDGPGATNGRSAPEKLAAAANDGDAYVNLVEAKYNRLLPVLAVNHPYYDKTDSDGDGFIDALDTGRDRADSFGPEIYRHGMINIKTAPPEVIRGMVPLQVERHGHNAWTISKAIADNDAIKNPADILTLEHQSIFINDNRDDDDNGSPDDHAERTWLYGYMSNWATVRTDTFAVYGTISIETVSGRKEGVRRFIAVLDRVPATAYPPFLEIQAGKTRPDANPNYLPVRVANFMWLE